MSEPRRHLVLLGPALAEPLRSLNGTGSFSDPKFRSLAQKCLVTVISAKSSLNLARPHSSTILSSPPCHLLSRFASVPPSSDDDVPCCRTVLDRIGISFTGSALGRSPVTLMHIASRSAQQACRQIMLPVYNVAASGWTCSLRLSCSPALDS